MISLVPEYGTHEYVRWRTYVTADSLRSIVDVTDTFAMQTLRNVLLRANVPIDLARSSTEQVLQFAARCVNFGELVLVVDAKQGRHTNQSCCIGQIRLRPQDQYKLFRVVLGRTSSLINMEPLPRLQASSSKLRMWARSSRSATRVALALQMKQRKLRAGALRQARSMTTRKLRTTRHATR